MKKQGTCLAALLGALCLFPQGALAEETVSATMKPVVVTATKTEHSLGETTADVSVVTREQIEKMPANNVLDVMRTMPGVTVDSARSFYGTSTQNKVIIRGMGGDDVNGRVLVLMDGLPVMTAGNNIFNWDTISLDTVERIEVVRGPASALYGSSAMGGGINKVSKPRSAPSSDATTHGRTNSTIPGPSTNSATPFPAACWSRAVSTSCRNTVPKPVQTGTNSTVPERRWRTTTGRWR